MTRYVGRTRLDPKRPQAVGECDRCGFVWNLCDLAYQYEWAGAQLIKTNLLVCVDCMDLPSVAKKAIVVPPDGLPVLNARPISRSVMTDRRVTMDDNQRVTETGGDRVLIDNPDIGQMNGGG
jgi:hypothetical protein